MVKTQKGLDTNHLFRCNMERTYTWKAAKTKMNFFSLFTFNALKRQKTSNYEFVQVIFTVNCVHNIDRNVSINISVSSLNQTTPYQ